MALAKYYFDFFKQNHEEIVSRLLLIMKLDPSDDKALVSFEQFSTLNQLSRGILSEEDKAETLCRLFGVSNVLYVDINEFLLVLRLFFSHVQADGMQKERAFRGIVDLLKAHGVVNTRRHMVNLTDLRSALLAERSTLLMLYRLIFNC